MKSSPLGCLTASGLIAGVLTLLVVGGLVLAGGGRMFSPGPLNAGAGATLGGVSDHAQLGGRCGACHAAFWSADRMADRCMECHADVASQMQDPATLHGLIAQRSPGLSCRSCHPDHRGPAAALTDVDPGLFPHEALGYSLTGHVRNTGGSPFACPDCHPGGYDSFDPAVCQTCHLKIEAAFARAHVLTFGKDCLACHDGLDTYGSDFDHNRYSFQLIGKHADVLCSSCHLNARSIADLQGAPVECQGCHAGDDAHQGRFGTDCGSCHTPVAWFPALFDHNLAAFKLEGEHVDVPCESCHVDRVYQGTPMDCFACHAADDVHDGRYSTNCAACHTAAGWLPADVDHNLFSFKLEGLHVDVPCESCHVNGVFQGTPTTCFACHAADDAHAGQFGTDCAACHTTAGWLPSTFNHNLTAFPLTGAHIGLPCFRCHTGGRFSGLLAVCAACHADPAYHAGLFGNNCAGCHNTSNWRASYTGPHPGGCDGNCINHEGASCRDCHTANLATATCLKCHDSNNPDDDGGDGGDDD